MKVGCGDVYVRMCITFWDTWFRELIGEFLHVWILKVISVYCWHKVRGCYHYRKYVKVIYNNNFFFHVLCTMHIIMGPSQTNKCTNSLISVFYHLVGYCMLLLWNHNSKHINVSLYSRRYVQYDCYIQLSVSDVFTRLSPLILWRRRAALVRSGKRYSREKTVSLKRCGESELCTVSAGCAVESLGQLCGAEQCVLVDTAAHSAGCEL
jgi:hypothetical protein